ncbi:MAG: hypothetical protein OEZ51_12130 [Nitrospinota bacterium]|nr:hypothetical protein [Nitrospinota bacterium]
MLIKNFLEQFGPSRSSNIVDSLIKEGITRETARQKISRAKKPVCRLKQIKLPRRESFIYLENQLGTQIFFENLQRTLVETRTSAGRALLGLISHYGVIPETFFKAVAAAPIRNTKKQLHYSTVLNQLESVELINKQNDPVYGEIICLNGFSELSNHQRAVLQAEDVFLSIFQKWIANTGMGSFNKIQIRGETPPNFGPFGWDIVAPSYLGPLVNFEAGKIKNGFVVGDILLDREVSASDIRPFIYKIDHILAGKNYRPFLPIYIAESFEKEALDQLRKKGVLIASTYTMLGKDAGEMLKSLIGIMENMTESISNDPKGVFEIISRVSKFEGAAENLRSMFLEMLIGHLLHEDGYIIDIRKNIKNLDDEPAEIDIFAEKKNRIICVECKGMAPGNLVKKEELEEWIDEKVPRIKSWLKSNNFHSKEKRFKFYASQGYEEDALLYLETVRENHKKVPIDFYDGDQIRSQLSAGNLTSLKRMFNEQFFN